MNLATWAVVTAIAGGCAVGVLLRQALLLLTNPGPVPPRLALAATAIGSFVLGALIGWCQSGLHLGTGIFSAAAGLMIVAAQL